MSASSSEDDMPEAVSFKETKIEHENFDNQVKEFLKEQRNALKDKRRRKQETLESLKKEREEKMKKLSKKREKTTSQSSEEEGRLQQQRLQKRLLPTEILNALRNDATKGGSESGAQDGKNGSESSDDEGLHVASSVRLRPKKMPRKSYDKLNIRVEALPRVENKRATSAIDFKSKRFGKVHRESIDKNRIHEEKLRASGRSILDR